MTNWYCCTMGTPRKSKGCCYLSIRIDSNAPAANCVAVGLRSVLSNSAVHDKFVQIDGKKQHTKRHRPFLPLHPQLNPAVWAD